MKVLYKIVLLTVFILPLCIFELAYANSPLRVAIMPTISKVRNHDEVILYLDKDLEKTLHMPLNNTTKQVEYLDKYKVLYAMEDTGFTQMQNLDTLKQTADLLNADVIVGYSVPMMYERYFHSLISYEDAPLMQSYISLKLWVYYRLLDKIIVFSGKEQYFDSISTAGALTELAKDGSYNLVKRADLKNLLKQSIKISQEENIENKKGDL